VVGVTESFTERFDRYWNDRPVTSLRRVQALYGAIAEAQSDQESVVPEEFRLYVTPGELDGFTTEEGGEDGPRLVTVYVDLTGEPTLDGVGANTSRKQSVSRLGFSRYPWGRGIDHSITRRGAKGGSSASTVTTYCVDCLKRWTDADGREPAVGRVADEHPDGWVITALQTLGVREELDEELRSLLEQKYSGNSRVVVTVAVKLDPDELAREPTGDAEDGYYYPGQLHVLNAGMRARKEEKLARKNLEDSDPPSRGEATCLLTGSDGEVFGTAEDPLAFFTVQHAEKFAGLKKWESWRAHSISSEAALLVQSGSSLVERFRTTRRGRSVFTIPYFTRMSARRAKYLKHVLAETAIETQADLAEVQRVLENETDADTDDLRFYVVVVRNDSGDINVLTEAPDLAMQPARELAEAHYAVLQGSTFHSVAGFGKVENWVPISEMVDRAQLVRSIVGGMYAYGTFEVRDEDAPAADDPVDWFTFSLLGGNAVPVETLFEEYVARVAAERRDDGEDRLPENHLKSQYAQLEALARAGLLTVEDGYDDTLTRMPSTDDTTLPPVDEFRRDDGSLATKGRFREYRLDRFIAERPSLGDDSPTSTARRGAFLAGVFVGQLGRYQANARDMNRTVIHRHPAEQMTGRRIERFVPELINKANVYASDDPYRGSSLFPELEDRLPETLTAVAGAWEIDTADLRFHYALGQLYGKRADYRAYLLRTDVADAAGIDLDEN
jgi:hypothetical protein